MMDNPVIRDQMAETVNRENRGHPDLLDHPAHLDSQDNEDHLVNPVSSFLVKDLLPVHLDSLVDLVCQESQGDLEIQEKMETMDLLVHPVSLVNVDLPDQMDRLENQVYLVNLAPRELAIIVHLQDLHPDIKSIRYDR